MKCFKCDGCGHFCEVFMEDRKLPPDICLIDGTDITTWKEHDMIIDKYVNVLKRILAAHEQSSVDWKAMREAKSLLHKP